MTLLIVMSALKLLEMRTSARWCSRIYLGFFLVMTNFLFSQSIPLGLYMLACVWIFVATLVGFNRVGATPTVRERLRPAGAAAAAGAAADGRPSSSSSRACRGRCGRCRRTRAPGMTGLSDTMTPGNISNLIKSDALAFRVQFEDELPAVRHALLARAGAVGLRRRDLEAIRSRTPRRQPRATRSARAPRALHRDARAARASTGSSRSTCPATLPAGAHAAVTTCRSARSRARSIERMRYEMTSYLDYAYGERHQRGATRAPRCASTRARNPRTSRSAGNGREESRSARDRREGARSASTGEFTYTLEPPLLDARDPYDDFLFKSKRGLLRALRRQLRAAHARRRHPGAHRDRLPGRRGEPAQQRAHRAPGRRARVVRDLARGPRLGARRSHGARSRRCASRAA